MVNGFSSKCQVCGFARLLCGINNLVVILASPYATSENKAHHETSLTAFPPIAELHWTTFATGGLAPLLSFYSASLRNSVPHTPTDTNTKTQTCAGPESSATHTLKARRWKHGEYAQFGANRPSSPRPPGPEATVQGKIDGDQTKKLV